MARRDTNRSKVADLNAERRKRSARSHWGRHNGRTQGPINLRTRVLGWWRWLWRNSWIVAPVALLALFAWQVQRQPWDVWTSTRHVLSFPNCDAARAFGLAPAGRGQPGYYAKHDADNDGIACEPWPRR